MSFGPQHCLLKLLLGLIAAEKGLLFVWWYSFCFGLFQSLNLPVLEHCSPDWISESVYHIRLLNLVVSKVMALCNVFVACNLNFRRRITSICTWYKIAGSTDHSLEASLPGVFVPARLTCLIISFFKKLKINQFS